MKTFSSSLNALDLACKRRFIAPSCRVGHGEVRGLSTSAPVTPRAWWGSRGSQSVSGKIMHTHKQGTFGVRRACLRFQHDCAGSCECGIRAPFSH